MIGGYGIQALNYAHSAPMYSPGYPQNPIYSLGLSPRRDYLAAPPAVPSDSVTQQQMMPGMLSRPPVLVYGSGNGYGLSIPRPNGDQGGQRNSIWGSFMRQGSSGSGVPNRGGTVTFQTSKKQSVRDAERSSPPPRVSLVKGPQPKTREEKQEEVMNELMEKLKEEGKKRKQAELRCKELEAVVEKLTSRLRQFTAGKRAERDSVIPENPDVRGDVGKSGREVERIVDLSMGVRGTQGFLVSHKTKGEAGKKEEEKKPEEVDEDRVIDDAILRYLQLNPDYPLEVRKLAKSCYVFGEKGSVKLHLRGTRVVVRVGGGFKSLETFMDERGMLPI